MSTSRESSEEEHELENVDIEKTSVISGVSAATQSDSHSSSQEDNTASKVDSESSGESDAKKQAELQREKEQEKEKGNEKEKTPGDLEAAKAKQANNGGVTMQLTKKELILTFCGLMLGMFLVRAHTLRSLTHALTHISHTPLTCVTSPCIY